MRLGFYSPEVLKRIRRKRNIWLHAVSVGEVFSAVSLLKALHREYPLYQMIISTITPTGNKAVQQIAQKKDLALYLPYDLSFIVDRVIKRFSPSLFIILETEFWPNLISILSRRGIPLLIINGRISEKAFRRYKRVKFLFSFLLAKIDFYCMQTEEDKKRVIALGAPPDRVRVTGNMKFDLEIPASRYKKEDLGMREEDILLIAASTHPNEEEMIIRVYKDINRKDVYLLIAPRHIERVEEIERIARKANFSVQQISNLRAPASIFLLDTVGELKSLFSIADIVFMGGSLVPKGGHNILEPAFFARPIIFGRYMFNFKEIARSFLSAGGAIEINDERELRESLQDLLDNKQKREEIGKRARSVLEKFRGATERNMEIIRRFLKEKEC